MTKGRAEIVRYSDCFKRSVIEEIEKNGLSIEECRRKYAIGGATTIQKWLKMYGKNHLLNKNIIILNKRRVLIFINTQGKQIIF